MSYAWSILIIITLLSCKNVEEKKEAAILPAEQKIIIDSGELRILYFKKNTASYNIDSFTSISRLNHSISPNSIKSVFFNLSCDSGINYEKIQLDYFTPQHSASISFPKRQFLSIEAKDSLSIYGTVGGDVKAEANIKNLFTAIKNFYQQEAPSSAHHEIPPKRINLLFLSDTILYINSYLEQIAKGYILAQREICTKTFHKNMKDALTWELDSLRRKTPLLINIALNKQLIEDLKKRNASHN